MVEHSPKILASEKKATTTTTTTTSRAKIPSVNFIWWFLLCVTDCPPLMRVVFVVCQSSLELRIFCC